MTNLFIPKKIRVGFQNRRDTFTGKLGYIIYYDEKNKIRKETSWKGWCDQKIPALEFENTPQSNYILNKGVQRYGEWGSGRSVIRVYDPRDFEFEISVDNLIGILMHSDISKRDIMENCVFAWAGAELVLLPINSQEYQDSIKYTEKQSKKISTKELVKGHTYTQKKNDTKLIYMGYQQYYQYDRWSMVQQKDKGKRHIFYDGNDFVIPNITTISSCILNEVSENFSKLVDDFFNSPHAYKCTDFKVLHEKIKGDFGYAFKQVSDDTFAVIYLNGNNRTIELPLLYKNIEYYTLTKTSADELTFFTGTKSKYRSSERYNSRIYYNYDYDYDYNSQQIIRNDEVEELKKILLNEASIVEKFNSKYITFSRLAEILFSLGYGNGYFYNKNNTGFTFKG